MIVGLPLLDRLADLARDPTWLGLWRAFAFLGSAAFFTGALPLLFAFLPWPKALRVAAAFGLAVTASEWIKAVVGRPRPDPAVFGLEEPLEWSGEFESAAFPSGHAAVGTAFWGTLARVAGGRRATLAAALLVAGISFSRLALLRHDLVDVGGGLLLGGMVVALGAAVDRRWTARLADLPWIEQAMLWLLVPFALQWMAGEHGVTVVAGVVGGLGAGASWAASRPARIARMGVGRGLGRFALGLAGAVLGRAVAGLLLPWIGMGEFAVYALAGLWVGGGVPALTGGAYEPTPAPPGPPRSTPGPAAAPARE